MQAKRSGCIGEYNDSMDITLNELEHAINHWRLLKPSTGEERALSPEVNTLANVYAMMIFTHQKALPMASLDPSCRQLLEVARLPAEPGR